MSIRPSLIRFREITSALESFVKIPKNIAGGYPHQETSPHLALMIFLSDNAVKVECVRVYFKHPTYGNANPPVAPDHQFHVNAENAFFEKGQYYVMHDSSRSRLVWLGGENVPPAMGEFYRDKRDVAVFEFTISLETLNRFIQSATMSSMDAPRWASAESVLNPE